MPSIISVAALGNHRLWLRFDDGTTSVIDLQRMVAFESTFAPLRDLDEFRKVAIDSGRVTWPSGASFDSDVLHAEGASTRLSYSDELKMRLDLLKGFCDSAKSYVQIASAALALPLFFTQIILGKQAMEQGLASTGVPRSLLVSWIAFSLAIVFGVLYQWQAIRLGWDELHERQRTPENKDLPVFGTHGGF